MNKKVRFITQSAAIAALYIVLTVFISAFGLASGVIQIRISEALCILPYFSLSAVPGLFIGCLVSNLITGCALWDVVFGSVATLLGAIFTYLLRNKSKYIAPIPAAMICCSLGANMIAGGKAVKKALEGIENNKTNS